MITAQILLPEIKSKLGITHNEDDAMLCDYITEAVEYLQKFRDKVVVDTVSDPAKETALTFLDRKFIRVYVQIEYDGDDRLQAALADLIETVRDK